MQELIPAVQLFTLRKYTQTPEGLRNTFKRVKEIGFDWVQLSCIGPISPETIRDYLNEFDLKVCVTHSPLIRMKNDLKNLIKEHKMWGCNCIGLGNLNKEYIDAGYKGYKQFIRDITPIVKELKENGMTFNYHSHSYEFVKEKGRFMYDMLIEDTDPEAFHFIQDTFWMCHAGVNHVNYINKVKNRMSTIHLKDYAIRLDWFDLPEAVYAEIGAGNIDFNPIIKACRENGVKYLAIEQDKWTRDPFECLEDSLSEVKKLLTE
jgi:sugar phosphate isomerase/epimerase